MFDYALFRSQWGKHFSKLKCMNLFKVHSESVSEGRFSEVYHHCSRSLSHIFFCVSLCQVCWLTPTLGSIFCQPTYYQRHRQQLFTNIIFSHMGDNNCDLHKAWMPCRVCRMASSLSPARWKKASVCAAKDEGRFAVTAT